MTTRHVAHAAVGHERYERRRHDGDVGARGRAEDETAELRGVHLHRQLKAVGAVVEETKGDVEFSRVPETQHSLSRHPVAERRRGGG